MKNDYENIIAPALINQINSLNNSYINDIKRQITELKQEFDSDNYQYIDILHEVTPNPHRVSRWPIMVFLFSAFFCLMCSTFFHLFYPMSSSNFIAYFRVIQSVQSFRLRRHQSTDCRKHIPTFLLRYVLLSRSSIGLRNHYNDYGHFHIGPLFL